MALFQQSSITFGSAKQFIAEQANKQTTTEMRDRAGRSLQAAIKVWNKYNWSWLNASADIIFGTAGTAALPYNFKEVYTLTWLGSTRRWIPARTRRQYDRLFGSDATQNEAPTRYDLFRKGNEGAISILGATAATGTANLKYYRKMTEPCAVSATGLGAIATGQTYLSSTAVGAFANAKVGNIILPSTGWSTAAIYTLTAVPQALHPAGTTGLVGLAYLSTAATVTATGASCTIGSDDHFLDIPLDYEWDIMALAVVHFLGGVGGADKKTQDWASLATNGLQTAITDDASEEDMDICFEPAPIDPEQWPWNPNRTWE